MPNKRTPIARASRPGRITDKAIELYKRALATDTDSDKGLDVYNDLRAELHIELGYKPWDVCPFDTEGAEPPQSVVRQGREHVANWTKANTIRIELERRAAKA